MTRQAAGILVGLSLALTSAVADDTKKPSTVQPVPRMEDWWQKRHEAVRKKASEGPVQVVFLGDSITQSWEGAGKKLWTEHFEPLKALNLGFSGDRTQHVLWRITAGQELEGIDPKLAVVMIGTNNTSSDSAEEIAQGVEAIVRTFLKAKPKAKVLLLGVFPRAAQKPDQEATKATKLLPKIKDINDRLANLADGKQVKYLDIGPKFLDSDGALPKAIMPDSLHLSEKGYQIWADAIRDEVKALLQ